MNALMPMHSPASRSGLPARSGCDLDASGNLFHELREWRQRTARQCEARGIALHWRIAGECRQLRLSRSELLHILGVLQEFIVLAIEQGRSRNLRVSLGCERNRVTLVVEDDGGNPDCKADSQPTRDHNVEYLAAEAAGTIRRRSRGRRRASIFCMRLNP